VLLPTPLEPAPSALAAGRRVFLKREDVHELGAFKWRGAIPVLEQYRERGADAVVTASTGNHGAATAWAARDLGLAAIVYAPKGASRTKVARLEQLGADLRLVGDDLDEAKDAARAFAESHAVPFFEDGAETAQFTGYETIGEEIVEQLGEPPGAVVVPVGNGALLAGIGRAVGRSSPASVRVGVVSKEAPAMALSWEARQPVDTLRCETFADGIAVRVAIPFAVAALSEATDRMLRVSERSIARAVAAYSDAGIRAEGAAAAALAALPQLADVADPVVLVVTGRNIDDDVLARCRDDPESFPE
jgi:threonine dehydratase